jgi:hypothetical protein
VQLPVAPPDSNLPPAHPPGNPPSGVNRRDPPTPLAALRAGSLRSLACFFATLVACRADSLVRSLDCKSECEGSNPSRLSESFVFVSARGSMDRAPDYESGDWRFESSRADHFLPVAQRIERWFPKPEVVGLIPTGETTRELRGDPEWARFFIRTWDAVRVRAPRPHGDRPRAGHGSLKPGIQVRILVPVPTDRLEHEATQLVTGAPSHGETRGSIPWPRTGYGGGSSRCRTVRFT